MLLLFPGMGTDARVFHRLQPYWQAWQPQVVEWQSPQTRTEPLAAYAQRIAAQLPLPEDPNEPLYLLGYSLGGILAATLIDYLPRKCQGLILLATAQDDAGTAWYFQVARHTGLHHVIPSWLAKHTVPMMARWTGALTEEEDVQLLRTMLEDSPPNHLAWGRHTAVNWQQTKAPDLPILQIHGEKDHIFPAHKSKAQVILPKAQHAMVLTHAEAIGQAVKEWLEAQDQNNKAKAE